MARRALGLQGGHPYPSHDLRDWAPRGGTCWNWPSMHLLPRLPLHLSSYTASRAASRNILDFVDCFGSNQICFAVRSDSSAVRIRAPLLGSHGRHCAIAGPSGGAAQQLRGAWYIHRFQGTHQCPFGVFVLRSKPSVANSINNVSLRRKIQQQIEMRRPPPLRTASQPCLRERSPLAVPVNNRV